MQAVEKSREEQIKRWADYVRTHPGWKKIHSEFIDAQFEKHNFFIRRLRKQKNGDMIIKKLLEEKLSK
jgi:hypothetical protein